MDIKRVQQEDAMGCGVAVLAMLTGQTYQAVKAELLSEMGRPDAFAERGIDFEVINEYLRRKGFAVATLWANCPMTKKPELNFPRVFGPVHYANVEQQSGNWHFVVVTETGSILDPLLDTPPTFDHYKRVGSIRAVYDLNQKEQASTNARSK